MVPKMALIRDMEVYMIDFMFETPKRHIFGRNGVFWRILRQNPSRALGCSMLQEPKKPSTFWCTKSRMRGNDTAGRIVTNFCTGVGVHDVITCADLYYARLRGLGVAGGQILAFSIDLLRRSTVRVCDFLHKEDSKVYRQLWFKSHYFWTKKNHLI